MQIRIEQVDPATPDAAALIHELDAHLSALYLPENQHLLSIETLRQPSIVFLTAVCGEKRVGCGALRNHGGEYGELKRMFVQEEYRGQGIALRLIQALETEARRQDLPIVRLETGIYQEAALRLYEKAGYVPCGPFGEYKDEIISRYREKKLSPL